MIFNLSNEFEHERFKEYVNKLYKGKAIVEVKKRLPNRSSSQNRYLHLLLGFFACETGYSLDEVKVDFFKRLCNKQIFEETKVNKKGYEVKSLRSSSTLSTGEMTTAIERFRNWSSSERGIYLPSPNEHQFLVYIEQEIERNKEFI